MRPNENLPETSHPLPGLLLPELNWRPITFHLHIEENSEIKLIPKQISKGQHFDGI